MESTVNKLESAFEKARAYYGRKSEADGYMVQLCELEQFVESEGYDAQMDDDDMAQLKGDFLAKQEHDKQAQVVIARILKLLLEQRANSPLGLLKAPLFRKRRLFEDCVEAAVPDGALSEAVECAVPAQFAALWDLEKVAASNRVAFTEYLVTCHHGSGQPLNEYSCSSPLMAQCRESGKVALYEKMQRYLVQYEHTVARPLPKTEEEPLSVVRFSDNINIVLSYMTEINSALHRMVKRRAFPLQIDVFFVAPGFHEKLR